MKIQKIECLQLRSPQVNAADCDGAVDTAVIRVTADNGMQGLGETDCSAQRHRSAARNS